MKIGILSRGPRLYSTKRIRETAEERGHKVRVFDTLNFAIEVEPREPDLYYGSRRVEHLDAVIPRIGASITFYGCAVLRQFEQMGVPVLNTSHSISVSRDKLRSLQVLSRHDIGIPSTSFVRRRQDILPAIERVGGAPVVIKVLEGTQGVGVILAETQKIAEAIIETLHGANQNVLVQKFVAESKGRDIRALVVGGRVVAAMRRTAAGQEFRSNVHRGGKSESVELSADYERAAVHAAQIMGLQVAGVDILEGKDGPRVMEVNSSPGLQGIETTTGINVAEAIIVHLENQVLFPEVDLRQRLTLSAGYGVAEFHIMANSTLANKSIAELNLRERDIIILSITRGGIVIPAPKGDQELLPNDVLVCYGKRLALRNLIPPKENRRRRTKKRKKKTASHASSAAS